MGQETFKSAELLSKELAPGHGSSVVHLLSCETCRWEALTRLVRAGRQPPKRKVGPAGNRGFDYSSMFQRIAAKCPEWIEEVRRTRQEAQRLLGRLLRRPPQRRWRAIEKRSFAHRAVVKILLEASEDGLWEKPAESENLAQLAARLAFRLDPALRKMSSHVVQAFCLAGNAQRRLGDWKQAEVSFERARLLALDRCDNGRYCRGLGLLRWEQGRSDEGLALLARSAKLFEREEEWQEYGVSNALIGILLIDERDYPASYDPLVRALAALDPEALPGLRARAGMALALSLAERGEKEGAQTLRTELRRGNPNLGEADPLPILWLEGRLAGSLGDRKDALALLDAVFSGYLKQGRWVEAVLAAVDESPWLANSSEREALFVEIERACAGREGWGESLADLWDMALKKPQGDQRVSSGRCVGSVRALLLGRGLRREPLPYA